MGWDPVRDLLSMQERLETLFGQTQPGWVPPVDIVELDDRYVVTLEVPGFTRDHLTLDGADNELTVRGTRPLRSNPERYQQLERGQGAFARTFRFALPVSVSDARADIADGVLTITVPKSAEGRRRIDVT